VCALTTILEGIQPSSGVTHQDVYSNLLFYLRMCYIICMVISMHNSYVSGVLGGSQGVEARPPLLYGLGVKPLEKKLGLFLVHFWVVLCFSINVFLVHYNIIFFKELVL
jgi:hypothetical protein